MIPLRDENPSRSFPFVNACLIIANVVAFVIQMRGPMGNSQLILKYAMIPSLFFSDTAVNWYRPVTYLFLHGGYLHIIGNMLFLYIFGNNTEDILGHARYLIFYIITGICAGLFQSVFSMHSSVPIIGASGAISGVLTAYMLLFPSNRILTLVFLGFFIMPVRIPAFIYITIWIVGQLVSGFASFSGYESDVAYLVHIGGIVSSLIYISFVRRRLLRRYYT